MAARVVAVLCLAGLVVLAAPAPADAGYGRHLPAKHGRCPHQNQVHGGEHALRKAMRCLVKEVRKSKGVHRVEANRRLARSADAKASDIRRCGSFSHYACGRDAFYWQRRYGYARGGRWHVAENIAWGARKNRSARQIMRAWLQSAPHRKTLFRGSYRDMGVGLARGRFQGRNASIWVLHVGCHC